MNNHTLKMTPFKPGRLKFRDPTDVFCEAYYVIDFDTVTEPSEAARLTEFVVVVGLAATSQHSLFGLDWMPLAVELNVLKHLKHVDNHASE